MPGAGPLETQLTEDYITVSHKGKIPGPFPAGATETREGTMSEITYKTRHRLNLSTSTKGIVTPEITVELIDGSMEDLIEQARYLYGNAQELAAELEQRVNGAEVQAADAG